MSQSMTGLHRVRSLLLMVVPSVCLVLLAGPMADAENGHADGAEARHAQQVAVRLHSTAGLRHARVMMEGTPQ